MPADEGQPREQVSSDGSFLSIPAAFTGAPEGLVHGFKMGFVTATTVTEEPGKGARQAFQTLSEADRVLVDLGAVDPEAVDLYMVERDCELLIRAIREHPEVVRQAISAACGTGQTKSGISSAAAALEGIGLTEQGTREEGGGIIGVLVVVAACLLLAGCEHCSHPITPQPEHPVSPH